MREVRYRVEEIPEQGGVQDLLQPLAVQGGLPAAPYGAHVVTELRHPIPVLLLSCPSNLGGRALILDLQVFGSVWAGTGEHPGVDVNLTERQLVTSETENKHKQEI